MKTQLTSLLTLALLSACGSAKSGSTDNTDSSVVTTTKDAASTSTSSLMLSDQGAASQTISAHIDLAIGALAEEPQDAAGTFLASLDVTGKMSRFRQCEVTGNTAVVTIDQNVDRDHSFTGPRRSYDNKFANYREVVRTWSRDGGSVACDSSDKYAKLDITTMAGVTLDATLKDTRSRSVSLTTKKRGSAVTTASKVDVTGSRHVVWKTVTPADTSYVITKEATHAISSQIELQKKDGTSEMLTSSVKNADGAPFEISVQRDKTTTALISRTINSGTLEATHKDGTRVETVFKKVVYTESADDKCTPTAGEIDGSVFAKDSATAALTFVIAFGDEPTITFSNGTTADYDQSGCELDDPSKNVVEAAAKTAVTPPAAATPAAPAT